MAFCIHEDNGVDEFVGVPSKTVVPTDGPLQVLKAGKQRRLEIILQAATQDYAVSRCKRVLFGAPIIADRYPPNIDERRKSFHAMMQAAKELEVALPIGHNTRALAHTIDADLNIMPADIAARWRERSPDQSSSRVASGCGACHRPS
jgi:hypothetical protein